MRFPPTLVCLLVAAAPAFAQTPPPPPLERAVGVVDAGVTTTAPVTTPEDLRAQMSGDEFDASLGAAIDEIHCGSTQKTASVSA